MREHQRVVGVEDAQTRRQTYGLAVELRLGAIGDGQLAAQRGGGEVALAGGCGGLLGVGGQGQGERGGKRQGGQWGAACHGVYPGAVDKRAQEKNPQRLGRCGFLVVWWWYRDLNLGHQHYECCALTN